MTNSRTEAENLEHPAMQESKETTKGHVHHVKMRQEPQWITTPQK